MTAQEFINGYRPNPATIWDNRLRWRFLLLVPWLFEILLRVEREDSYAAELLHSDRLSKLSSVIMGSPPNW